MDLQWWLSLPSTLWAAARSPVAKRAAGKAVVAGMAIQIGLFLLRDTVAGDWIEVLQFFVMAIMLPATALITGYVAAPWKPAALGELLRSAGGCAEPFLLGRAARVIAAAQTDDERVAVDRAIEELSREINSHRKERDYLTTVASLIRENSVWAVCGRKHPDSAPAFWTANVISKEKGHHIERIFLPPATPIEESDAHAAIRLHLEHAMIVRLVRPAITPHEARANWRLPDGFGMTIMGTRPGGNDQMPDVTCVLVHWGTIGKDTHQGVLLRDPVWKEHFWKLFTDIALQDTDPWNGGNDFARLLAEHSTYRPSGVPAA